MNNAEVDVLPQRCVPVHNTLVIKYFTPDAQKEAIRKKFVLHWTGAATNTEDR